MSLLGKIQHFNPELEGWIEYVEHLEQFFEANKIVGNDNKAKHRSTFLSVVGPGPYKLLRSIMAPVKPSKLTFEQLVEVLQKIITLLRQK